MHSPYKIVQMFEENIAEYTGAPYAVSMDSCTNALFLSLLYCKLEYDLAYVEIPKKTYLSVPQSAIHAGLCVIFDDREWSGCYQLSPSPVYDSAKRLTSDMYIPRTFMCLSFHIKKLLSIGKGGMILCDDEHAVDWFQKARYEGRSQKFYKEDDISTLGWNMYMTPQQAAHGMALLQNYPKKAKDMGEDNGYRDLTEMTLFKHHQNVVKEKSSVFRTI